MDLCIKTTVEMTQIQTPCLDIARECGRSQVTVRAHLRKHGMIPWSSRKPAPSFDELWEACVVDGLTHSEAAKKLGCCYSTVLRHVRQHGIKPKREGKAARPA